MKIILPKDVESTYSPFNYDKNIPSKWKEVALFNNLNIGIICVDGLCGAINLDGEIVIPIEYENLIDFIELNNTHILAKKDGFWGYISWENKTLIPFEYSYASVFQNGKAKVCKNGSNYLINEQNEILIELDEMM